MNNDLILIEDFLIDNPQLERLEALLDEFNIFEALGAVNVELRHSEFLAFLMNPKQSHGLDEVFVKRFLQKAVAGVESTNLPFTAIDLDIWNLDDLEVRREWRHIDILLLHEEHKLAVIIENKIGSREHSNQLNRYYQSVEQQFPGWKILGLYLTPEGDEPSDQRYLPVGYETVCSLIENICQSRKSTLGPDIHTLMAHYTAMLRRYILSESEIAKLCQKIYRKHQRAIDMILEYRPDLQAEIYDHLQKMIANTEGVTEDVSSKVYVRFVADELDTPLMKTGSRWTSTGRILMFELVNGKENLTMYLLVGPGPAEIRDTLFKFAKGNNGIVSTNRRANTTRTLTIFKKTFLINNDYENDIEELIEKINSTWHQFMDVDLPAILEELKTQKWIWEEPKE